MVDETTLLNTLRRITEEQFGEVLFRIEGRDDRYCFLRADIPSKYAPQTERATALIVKLKELNGLNDLIQVIKIVTPGYWEKYLQQ